MSFKPLNDFKSVLSLIDVKEFPKMRSYKLHAESYYFVHLLNFCKGNLSVAAKVSGVGRPYLYKKLKQCNISPEWFRTGAAFSTDNPFTREGICDLCAKRFELEIKEAKERAEQAERDQYRLEELSKQKAVVRKKLLQRGIIKDGVFV